MAGDKQDVEPWKRPWLGTGVAEAVWRWRSETEPSAARRSEVSSKPWLLKWRNTDRGRAVSQGAVAREGLEGLGGLWNGTKGRRRRQEPSSRSGMEQTTGAIAEPRKARPRRPSRLLYPTDQTATAVGDAPKRKKQFTLNYSYWLRPLKQNMIIFVTVEDITQWALSSINEQKPATMKS